MATEQAIEKVITQAADKIIQAVEIYGPRATELVLQTGRVAAMQDLVWGAIWAGVGIVLWLFVAAASALGVKNDEEGYFFAAFVSACMGFIAFFIAVGYLGSVFAWTGLNHPEIYLAAKLLKL